MMTLILYLYVDLKIVISISKIKVYISKNDMMFRHILVPVMSGRYIYLYLNYTNTIYDCSFLST